MKCFTKASSAHIQHSRFSCGQVTVYLASNIQQMLNISNRNCSNKMLYFPGVKETLTPDGKSCVLAKRSILAKRNIFDETLTPI